MYKDVSGLMGGGMAVVDQDGFIAVTLRQHHQDELVGAAESIFTFLDESFDFFALAPP